ncbi:hypothetical protein CXF40_03110 [Corynebacterium bovis]|uniref:hypothetical protein n=3 Tax=Corynebacterium bovis TaxID=36808 RepID=UPI000F64A443|nr:hypothetical protein [Corynebacterium bovis]RRO92679.1 hypothetical protein CXF40_03110 [Corynebacterium bovis]RRO98619.1 hypothetical protein CXF32_00280 [Corynebacterium bovis]RRQ00422.1 hypothetical protein CXF31_00715 [Corynebacterium bovis]RRQ13528.1 hypothetical protein CXF34_00510 [Corynebacterium bovis]RRQ19778.1 hypothetical protein CXF33_00395 [Corynebacterium bovis]
MTMSIPVFGSTADAVRWVGSMSDEQVDVLAASAVDGVVACAWSVFDLDGAAAKRLVDQACVVISERDQVRLTPAMIDAGEADIAYTKEVLVAVGVGLPRLTVSGDATDAEIARVAQLGMPIRDIVRATGRSWEQVVEAIATGGAGRQVA